jgi:hypothetical protein
MAEKKHVVVRTSIARYPSENGWLYYYCQTCGPENSICAALFNHESGFDYDGYASALAVFNTAHPHSVILESQWAQ